MRYWSRVIDILDMLIGVLVIGLFFMGGTAFFKFEAAIVIGCVALPILIGVQIAIRNFSGRMSWRLWWAYFAIVIMTFLVLPTLAPAM